MLFRSLVDSFGALDIARLNTLFDGDSTYAEIGAALAERLRQRHQLSVRILPVDVMPDVLRRLDLHARQLQLSEQLDQASRNFQIAVQLAMLEQREAIAALADGAGLVVLDSAVTPELEAEGWAKDRIRELQELRKNSGLEVSDRISVVIAVPEQRLGWAQTHADLIAGEILATGFEFGEPADPVEIGDGVRVCITKA